VSLEAVCDRIDGGHGTPQNQRLQEKAYRLQATSLRGEMGESRGVGVLKGGGLEDHQPSNWDSAWEEWNKF